MFTFSILSNIPVFYKDLIKISVEKERLIVMFRLTNNVESIEIKCEKITLKCVLQHTS
jgi:hypothetical protein